MRWAWSAIGLLCALAPMGCHRYSIAEYRGPGVMEEPESGPDYRIRLPKPEGAATDETYTLSGLPGRYFQFKLPKNWGFNLCKHPEEIPSTIWYEVTIRSQAGEVVYRSSGHQDPREQYGVEWVSSEGLGEGDTRFGPVRGETYIVRLRGAGLGGKYLEEPVLETE